MGYLFQVNDTELYIGRDLTDYFEGIMDEVSVSRN